MNDTRRVAGRRYDTTVDATTSLDRLRPGECPSCGYALEGLAPEGRCPECGGRYNQFAVVLHGYAAGRFADVATARPWRAAGIAGAYVVVLIWVYQKTAHGRDSFPIYCILAAAAWLAWMLWKRWTRDMPGQVQVRVSAYGARLVKNPMPGEPQTGTVTPWRDVGDVSLDATGQGLIRFRLLRRESLWWSPDVALDAELRCTPEQAASLRERIAAWRAEETREREELPDPPA